MKLSLRIGIGVTVIILAVNLLAFRYIGQRTNALLEHGLRNVSRHLHHELVVVRGWVAHHGGVYIEKRPGVQANPFLDDDIAVTAGGDTLVLRNPAMITRELSTLSVNDGYRFTFHITSLDPLNPANAPREGEREALERIQGSDGEPSQEVTWVEDTPDGRRYRYLAPLMTEESCLRCHGGQGYEVGDVRGALSISIPMVEILDSRQNYFVLSVLVCLLASALIAGLVHFFIKRAVVRRVHQLESAAERIGHGDFETPVPVRGSDEIGGLGEALGRMQQELRHTTDRQIEAEKMFSLGQVAAGIAHDVRNPLFAVRNDLDYLRRRGARDDDEAEVYLEMEDGLARIDRIVAEVNDFARPHPPEFGRHSLGEVVDAVMLLLGKQLQKESVRIRREIPDDLPEIEMDRHRMEQVLVNLLGNALRAVGDRADGEVTLRARLEDELVIEVADNGCGIREEILGRIFDPFFTRSPNGTGLGLTIVKRVVLQHGGSVRVESEEGRFTVFTLRLPLHQPRRAEESHELPTADRR